MSVSSNYTDCNLPPRRRTGRGRNVKNTNGTKQPDIQQHKSESNDLFAASTNMESVTLADGDEVIVDITTDIDVAVSEDVHADVDGDCDSKENFSTAVVKANGESGVCTILW